MLKRKQPMQASQELGLNELLDGSSLDMITPFLGRNMPFILNQA